jgi:hypothetical protein
MASRAPKLFQVASACVVWIDGNRVHLNPSPTVYDDTHPLVRKFPNVFRELVPLRGEKPKVEQATAAPGEARDVPDPKK